MRHLRLHVLVGEEVVGDLRRTGHLAAALQPQHEEVQHKAVVLHHEGGKLEAPDHTVRVGVVHVLREGGGGGGGEWEREGVRGKEGIGTCTLLHAHVTRQFQ